MDIDDELQNVDEDLQALLTLTVEVIGIGRRLITFLIDALIIVIIQVVLVSLVAALATTVSSDGGSGSRIGIVAACFSFIISATYFVVFWGMTGQTVGKMALGFKVIGLSGEAVSWETAILRYFGYFVSGGILGIGFIWAGFDAKRQGWHDKLAKTLVVRKDTFFSPSVPVTFIPADQGSLAAIFIAIMWGMVIIIVPAVIVAILALFGPLVSEVFSNIVGQVSSP